MNIQPYEVHISDDILDDLRDRLSRTRWPDELEDVGWDYGSSLAYIRELCEYWQDGFDWRAQEASINEFDHYRADVDGLGIHFIHARGQGPDPIPLVITHRMAEHVRRDAQDHPVPVRPRQSRRLCDSDSFDVIVPSMPGYGFSDRPTQRGMSPTRIAELWNTLMTEALGYDRFVAQGGDWGAQITTTLGLNFPQTVGGIHLTMAAGGSPNSVRRPAFGR